MDITLIIVLFLIGFIGSFISGMVGIGGSIIKYPMLLYIPAVLGLGTFTAHEVAGISAIQVLFASIAGVWAYRKGGNINKKLIVVMGSGILLGSLIGGFVSTWMAEGSINFVYGILGLIASVMMFLPKNAEKPNRDGDIIFPKTLAFLLAFIVGIGSGIVGAAGAFLLVPIMLIVLKIPTRMTIASSLAITFISSIGTASAKIITNQILYGPAFIMIIASLIAAPLGAKMSQKMNTKVLQIILSIIILATTIRIWIDFIKGIIT